MSYLQTLDTIVTTIVLPGAQATDRDARFPRAAIDALGQAGLLGLVSSKDVGGMGLGLPEAAQLIERLAKACPSTAMVVCMHLCAATVLEKFASESVRRDVAGGRHLSTLAWSDNGSRSHFWAPVGTARQDGDGIVIDGSKSMVTAAGEADSYVWSTAPVALEGASTLWLVDSKSAGLSEPKAFDGMGLRGNRSSPISATGVRVAPGAMLGLDGGGFDIMIGAVLPVFSTLIASSSLGQMEAVLEAACAHAAGSKLEHLGSALADLPTIRAYLARARIAADMVRTLRDDTIAALAANRPDAMLRVMQVKAAAAEAALEVTDSAMRVCGGAAFRKDVGIERYFRDARAASVMAPTSDVLFDFIGKAVCGMPVFG
ncbi:acyl-CoA dehydrogenase family protein [Massilia antarctica]|uniref:acyl-CoA dehydrogenase family protein n=1 Tax=Massilia antarctica TaxID=2765360 RepID=UPI0006BB7E63|nr:acyl-CoA dehydrogenase family protein [Massilia sp. H27-R4]MCY0910626.1 acyl-CoA/acyl-ACP dehydrogenase [Massilia sp. H27-R4]CUI09010.1 Acyl-CoA dehydrogenase, short-chain specific [Janthinobacterium sp. CG23_2]CUU32796.1 Acyl-CoA dehydrogenase, short-chain specific [Janthinobacterium sp. CG23_2]